MIIILTTVIIGHSDMLVNPALEEIFKTTVLLTFSENPRHSTLIRDFLTLTIEFQSSQCINHN